MDKTARLKNFCEFKNIIQNDDNVNLLKKLSIYELNDLNNNAKKEIKPFLSALFRNLKIMKEGRLLIGTSKILHHLLPHLILPIDRHTLNFFYEEEFKKELAKIKIYQKMAASEEEQERTFLEIFNGSYLINKKLDLRTIYLERKDKENFTTSIPKLIDNAIIGYVEDKSK